MRCDASAGTEETFVELGREVPFRKPTSIIPPFGKGFCWPVGTSSVRLGFAQVSAVAGVKDWGRKQDLGGNGRGMVFPLSAAVKLRVCSGQVTRLGDCR